MEVDEMGTREGLRGSELALGAGLIGGGGVVALAGHSHVVVVGRGVVDVVLLEFEGELILGQEPLRAGDAEDLFLAIADERREADGARIRQQCPAL